MNSACCMRAHAAPRDWSSPCHATAARQHRLRHYGSVKCRICMLRRRGYAVCVCVCACAARSKNKMPHVHRDLKPANLMLGGIPHDSTGA